VQLTAHIKEVIWQLYEMEKESYYVFREKTDLFERRGGHTDIPLSTKEIVLNSV